MVGDLLDVYSRSANRNLRWDLEDLLSGIAHFMLSGTNNADGKALGSGRCSETRSDGE